jgi:transposase InsO family protein
MPWKANSAMEVRQEFVKAARQRKRSMVELCRAFGISRQCGYKWLARFWRGEGLSDRSRAPHSHPHAVEEETAHLVLQLRNAQPTWGARKLVEVLARQDPRRRWPAPSTVGELLRREGLTRTAQTRKKVEGPWPPAIDPQSPNDVWCADFKGHFATNDGQRCHPLTISDSYSRYLLLCDALPSESEALTRRRFERTFGEYGMPLAIRTDNGTPFSGTGGLSKLSVWWVKLGIQLQRIPRAKPQRNGRHERMHRTLKEDTAGGPLTMGGNQRRLDAWREVYNHQRPHQSLGMQTPASLYSPSRRELPSRTPEIEYGPGWELRRVRANGALKWHGAEMHLCAALAGEWVGLYALESDLWAVHFGPLRLAIIDERERQSYLTQVSTMSPV